jgi:plastocyanin
MPRPMLALLAMLCIPCVIFAQAADATHSGAATRVNIVANDYAFMPLPPHISPGAATFTFTNRGKVYHELALARLKTGVTIEDLVKAVKEGGRVRAYFDRSVGILMAGPGQSPDGRLMVDLQSGQTYVVYCNFKDTPEAPAHLMLGMYATFRP